MAIDVQKNIAALEQKLLLQKDSSQRLVLIDHLTTHYAFTNVERAIFLLAEQDNLLDIFDYPDFKLNFFLNKGIVKNHLYHFEEAETYFLKALKMVEEIGTAKQQVAALIDYAGICTNLQQIEKAASLLKRANNLLKIFPDPQLSAKITCREGYINLLLGNYSKAIEEFLHAQKVLESHTDLSIKDYYFLTLIYSGQGKVFEKNDDTEKSVKAYLKVVEMCESLQMHTRLSWHYLNLGNAFMSLNEQENAVPYFLKIIEIDNGSSEHSLASAYGSLGYIYFEEERYNEALDLFDQAESIYKAISEEDYYNFSIMAAWRGRLYAEVGKEATAAKEYEKAYHFAKKINDAKQLSSVSKDIAAFYADGGKYKKAYEFQLAHDEYLELHNEQIDKARQRELEAKYDAAEKIQETEMLKIEATSLRLKALRAQMNPHFMYNALNSIQSFITSKDPGAAAKYLAKFAKLMRQNLDYSEVEVISLEKEIDFLENYLYINEKLRFKDKLQYKFVLDDELEEDIIAVPSMIIQPYIENALEHGLRSKENGMITITFSLYDEDTIFCTVEDNGIGREKVKILQQQDLRYQNHRSRGTSITEKRLQILQQSKGINLHVNIVDLKNEATGEAAGTRVEMKIPILDIHLR